MEAIKLCSVEKCKGSAGARGLCKKHYKRWQRHGDVEYNSRPKVVAGENNNKHPLYKKWRSITRREDSKNICERWSSFLNFVQDIQEVPFGATIFKRIDPLRPFGPDNYFWSNSRQLPQAKNKELKRLPKKKPQGTHKRYHRTRELNLMKK